MTLPIQPSAALWDLDGVLIDTAEFHYLSWAETLPAYGIAFSRDAFKALFGMNNASTIARLLGKTPDPALVAEITYLKETNFLKAIHGKAQLLPGVRTLLIDFRNAGLRQAIASSAPPGNIDALIDELDLRPFFDALVSGYGYPSKPDPSVFLRAAAALQTPPARCLVIEDSVAGVEGARRAGMKCLAVTNTNPASALQSANLVVDRLDQNPVEVYLGLIGEGQ